MANPGTEAGNWRSGLQGAVLGSMASTAAVVAHAFHTKKQFYPAVVMITNSNVSMLVIQFQAFVMCLLVARVFQRIFFGKLRDQEREDLYDRSWFAVTETCLAMTIFRDEFTPKIFGLFGLLLAVKAFHWLAQLRVEWMENAITDTKFHVRMVSVCTILAAIDGYLIYGAVVSVQTTGPSMQLLFGFEYIALAVAIVTSFIKYCLNAADTYSGEDTPWEAKKQYFSYLDLLSDFLKLIVYISFFLILMNFYGLPLHIIRDLCATFSSFIKRVNDFIQSRKAMRSLDLLPNATPEELATEDICIICRDEMHAPLVGAPPEDPASLPKKLPCGHIFHFRCCRDWLRQQPTCPTCRTDVLGRIGQEGPAGAAAAAAARAEGAGAAPAAAQAPAAPAAVPPFPAAAPAAAAAFQPPAAMPRFQPHPQPAAMPPFPAAAPAAAAAFPAPAAVPQIPAAAPTAYPATPATAAHAAPAPGTPAAVPPAFPFSPAAHLTQPPPFTPPPGMPPLPGMGMGGMGMGMGGMPMGMPGFGMPPASPFMSPGPAHHPMMGMGGAGMGSPFGGFGSPYANMSGFASNPYAASAMGGGGVPTVGGQQLPAGFVPFSFNAAADAPVSSLSEAEVLELEGSEREKVEARIEFLRRYRAELDAMLGRFGQYDTVRQRVDSRTTTPAAATANAAAATAGGGGGGGAAAAAGGGGGGGDRPIGRSSSVPEQSSAVAAQREEARQSRVRKFSERKDGAEN